MRGVIYTRVSGDEQIKGTSLEFQEDACVQYCRRRGIEVLEIFREQGETAKDLSLQNRKQFIAAMELCRKARPAIDAFVVLKVNRFARNTDDHFSVRRILRKYGTSLHSVTEPIGDRPVEKLMETVLAGTAEYENEIRKQACIDGLDGRLNQGIWPWTPPAGYVRAPVRDGSRKKTEPDVPDSELFSLIRKGLLAYGSGEIVSQGALARQLNLWGYERVTGKKATAYLAFIMVTRNLAYYTGMLTNPFTGKKQEGRHRPMLSKAEAARITARRIGRVHPPARTPFNVLFPLRRILTCSGCGRFLTGGKSQGNGGTYGYYFCINRACSLRGSCLNTRVVHPAFNALLLRLEANPEAIPRIEERVRELWAERRRGETVDALQSTKLVQLKERRNRVLLMAEEGTYDSATVRDRLAAVDIEIARLESDPVPNATIADFDVEEVATAAKWFLSDLGQIWGLVTSASRSRFERVAFPKGLVFSSQTAFQTAETGPIFGLFQSEQGPAFGELYFDENSLNQEYEYYATLLDLYRELNTGQQGRDDDTAALATG